MRKVYFCTVFILTLCVMAKAQVDGQFWWLNKARAINDADKSQPLLNADLNSRSENDEEDDFDRWHKKWIDNLKKESKADNNFREFFNRWLEEYIPSTYVKSLQYIWEELEKPKDVKKNKSVKHEVSSVATTFLVSVDSNFLDNKSKSEKLVNVLGSVDSSGSNNLNINDRRIIKGFGDSTEANEYFKDFYDNKWSQYMKKENEKNYNTINTNRENRYIWD